MFSKCRIYIYFMLYILNYYDILKKGINNNYNYSKGLRINKILSAVKIEEEMRGENKFHD